MEDVWATSGNVSLTAPGAVTTYSLILPSTVAPANNYALVSDTSGTLSSSQMTTPNPSFQSVTVTNTTTSSSTGTGALTIGGGLGVGDAVYVGGTGNFGGNISLTGGSGANMIISNVNGLVAPTYTTRSPGTRFVAGPGITSTATDYAIGMMSNYMWFSASTSTTDGFKWYSGTKNTMTLDYAGNLSTVAGGSRIFTGSTSGTITLTPPASITSYTLTFPTSLPSATNMALVSDMSGTLTWAQMITPNPVFTTVGISASTANSGLGTGALIVTGGGSIGAGLSLKGSLRLVGNTSGIVTLNVPDTNSSPTFTLPSSLPSLPGQILQADTQGNFTWVSVGGTTATFSASIANNSPTPVVVPGLSFTSAFKIDVYVSTTTSTGTYGTFYTLRGFKSNAGWQLLTDYAGDQVNLIGFTIDSVGQIYYNTGNVSNWTGATATWTGPSVYSTPPGGTPSTASGANNQSTPANVSGLVGVSPQFTTYVLVTVNSSIVANSTTTLYLLQGTQQPNGSWTMNSQSVSGPDSGIIFSIISSTGQIQYTSINVTGWLSTTFSFYGNTIPLQNGASYMTLQLMGTTDSSSAITGAFTVGGGVGIAKSLNVGSTTDSSSAITGAFTVGGGVGIAKSLNVGGTTDSSSAITGAFTVGGGVGIAKSLNVGSTTDSSSAITGAFTVGGGVGIAKSLNVGSKRIAVRQLQVHLL